MSRYLRLVVSAAAASLVLCVLTERSSAIGARTQVALPSSHLVERFAMPASGPVLDAPSLAGRFVASIGARAAALGHEHRPFELWVWPLKIADEVDVAFSLEG